MEKEVLQGYLQKLMTLQDEKDLRYTEADFRIAIDKLGLTDKEKEELNREFDQQFKQGSNYYKHQNYKKALEYLLVAQQIEPFHLATLMLITDCYKHLYLETYSLEYYERTEECCQRGLQMQSHNPYFAKVETLIEEHRKVLGIRNVRGLGVGAGFVLGAMSVVAGMNVSGGGYFLPSIILAGVLTLIPTLYMLPTVLRLRRLHNRLKRTTLTLKFIPKS